MLPWRTGHFSAYCRKLRHRNIVEFYGVAYSSTGEFDSPTGVTMDTMAGRGGGDKTLMLLLEYCEENLEEVVFKNETWQCRWVTYVT